MALALLLLEMHVLFAHKQKNVNSEGFAHKYVNPFFFKFLRTVYISFNGMYAVRLRERESELLVYEA